MNFSKYCLSYKSNLIFYIFSKTDLKGSRSLAEVRNVMRINHLLSTSVNSQLITLVNFNVVTKENVEKVFDWCMQFVIPAPVTEPAQWKNCSIIFLAIIISINIIKCVFDLFRYVMKYIDQSVQLGIIASHNFPYFVAFIQKSRKL